MIRDLRGAQGRPLLVRFFQLFSSSWAHLRLKFFGPLRSADCQRLSTAQELDPLASRTLPAEDDLDVPVAIPCTPMSHRLVSDAPRKQPGTDVNPRPGGLSPFAIERP